LENAGNFLELLRFKEAENSLFGHLLAAMENKKGDL
jgi:hypothetical protein